MNCSLWLNRKKVNTAAQIPENLDVASLRGYFLAGSLIEWLEEHGGKKYAAKLSELSHDDPRLNEKIAQIFKGTPLPAKPLNGDSAVSDAFTGAPLQTKADGSFKMPNSFRFTGSSWLGTSSFAMFGGSGATSFAEFGSFLAYLRGLYGGSFGATSFFITSFSMWEHEWEWLWEFLRNYSSGSFVSTSFSASSFSQFGSFFPFWVKHLENIDDFPSSWGSSEIWKALGIDEYDYIMFKTLMICPLDRFGYGIHII